jgi:hypothetical protein
MHILASLDNIKTRKQFSRPYITRDTGVVLKISIVLFLVHITRENHAIDIRISKIITIINIYIIL